MTRPGPPADEWARDEKTPVDPEIPTEPRFIHHLNRNPGDVAMRLVFADWLEEVGQGAKAALLRMIEDPELAQSAELREASGAVNPDWLATVSRARIERCDAERRDECPGSWAALRFVSDASMYHPARFCEVCQKRVYFCTNLQRACEYGYEQHRVAFSSALVREEALALYDRYLSHGRGGTTEELEALELPGGEPRR